MQELKVVPQFIVTLIAQPAIVVLLVQLVVAAVIDWRSLRIPNWLTVGGMALALVYHAAFAPPGGAGFLGALAGMGVGLVVLLPLYALRVMGAGDVKLMAMVGAFLGLPDILYAVLCSLIAGGVAAIGFALYYRAFRRMAGNVTDIAHSVILAAFAGHQPPPATARASIGKLPYALSICAGTIAWLAVRQWSLA